MVNLFIRVLCLCTLTVSCKAPLTGYRVKDERGLHGEKEGLLLLPVLSFCSFRGVTLRIDGHYWALSLRPHTRQTWAEVGFLSQPWWSNLSNFFIRSPSTVNCVRKWMQEKTAKPSLDTLLSTRCALAWPASSYSSVSSLYGSTTARAAERPYITGKKNFSTLSIKHFPIIIADLGQEPRTSL